jgi:hypothetical protein
MSIQWQKRISTFRWYRHFPSICSAPATSVVAGLLQKQQR